MINKNDEVYDLVINVNEDECIYSDKIVDPLTRYNISGYIIKDNTSISINLSNRNILARPLVLINYYCRILNGKNIMIKNMDQRYTPSTKINVIPEHTYKMLKSTNRLKDRLFMLKVKYDVINNDLINQYPNLASMSNTDMSIFKLDIYRDRNDNFIETKEQTFCFQLVSADEFEAYKLINKKSGESDNSTKIKSPK